MTDGTKELIRNLFLYGIIGSFSAGIDASIFYICTYANGMEALVANMISVPIGILASFLLNRKFNFKVTDHPLRRGLIFFGVGFVGLILSQIILACGTSIGIETILVKLLSIFIVAIVQFILNKLISFGVRFSD